jgi:hypothetical protein
LTDATCCATGYAIAAYTIQAGEGGDVSIANSTLTATDGVGANNDGIDYRIYVNDTLISNGFVTASSLSFNTALGTLKAGDTVYVCIGNNVINYGDHFTLAYQLVSVPEPKTLALLGFGAAGLLAFAWRNRRTDIPVCPEMPLKHKTDKNVCPPVVKNAG